MHMKIKRIISVLLCFVVLSAIIPGISLTANAGTYRTESQVRTVLDSIINNEFKSGSYFTKNNQKCSEHGSMGACNNCSLSGVLSRSDIKTAVTNAGISTKNFYSACYTCQAFASYCYTRCFNVPAMGTANGIKASSNYTTVGNVTDKKTQSVKNLLLKAKAGDLIFIEDGNFKHWYVVYSVSSSGVTILDNNGNAPNSKSIGTVRKATLAFSAFSNRASVKLRRSKFLSTSDTPATTTPTTPTTPAPSNAVTKWTISVSGITETSATVRADVQCTPAKLSKIGLEMGTTASNMKSVASWKVGSVLTYCSVKCDGSEAPKLSSGTTYYYRFYVVRTDGKYEYSSTGNFTTKSAVCTNHTYDSGTITAKATCTASGTVVYKCTKCSATKTDTVKATGHTAQTVAGRAATCTVTGLTDGTKCSVCNAVIKEQTVIPVTAHNYTSQKKEATCTENGYIHYTCKCGAAYDEVITAKGHKPGSWTVVKQPQAGASGLEEVRCTVCSAVLDSREIVPSYITGDVDRDGKITAGDARIVLRISVKLEYADAATAVLADFNKDGAITADDARSVLRKSVGLI